VNLFTGGDGSYFAAAGIGDLQHYFLSARRANWQQESGIALFNLLEEVMCKLSYGENHTSIPGEQTVSETQCVLSHMWLARIVRHIPPG